MIGFGFWLGVVAVGCVIFAALLLWLAVIGARTVLDWWGRQWRDARAVIEESREELACEPVPYLPACLCPACERLVSEHAALLAALCDPCRGGDGECACTSQCGQPPCTGGLSDETVRFLAGLTMPEGTDQ